MCCCLQGLSVSLKFPLLSDFNKEICACQRILKSRRFIFGLMIFNSFKTLQSRKEKFLQFRAHMRRHRGAFGKRMQHGNAEIFSLWDVRPYKAEILSANIPPSIISAKRGRLYTKSVQREKGRKESLFSLFD